MSVKIMGLVWDCGLPRNEKYILLALADHADHEGRNIYPSVGRVAWKTGYDERMVQRLIKKLIIQGVLVGEGSGKRGTNRYRIEIKCLPQRPDYEGGQNVTPGKMPPLNVQNVTPTPGKMPPESSSNHPLTVMGATPANGQTDVDTFEDFTPKVPQYTPANGKSLGQRIKNRDPQLLMTALGVTAKDKATPGQQRIKDANWRIQSDRIELGIAAFLDATHFDVPSSKSERGKWLTGVKDHLEKFPADRLSTLYRLAWEEYKPAVFAGEIDVTHPAALTNKMIAISQRSTITPSYNHDDDPSVLMSRGYIPEFRRKDEQ